MLQASLTLSIASSSTTATNDEPVPDNPDAIKSGPNKGYVEYPNVNIVNEMVDLITEIFTSDTYGYRVCERDFDLAGNALSTMTLSWE